MNINDQIFFIMHEWANRSEVFDFFVLFFANYFQYFVILGVIYFLVFHHDIGLKGRNQAVRKLREILLVFASAILSLSLVSILKYLFADPRPFIAYADELQPLFLYGGWESFPSGHAMFFAALAMSMYLIHPRFGKWLFLCAIFIAMSRVIAGVHFPVDIFFGFIFGIVSSYLFFSFIYKVK
jgi:membrane-associated phospholipid phosphatase